MIGSGHCEREDSEFGSSVRRPEIPSYDASNDQNSNSNSNSKENEMKGLGRNGIVRET